MPKFFEVRKMNKHERIAKARADLLLKQEEELNSLIVNDSSNKLQARVINNIHIPFHVKHPARWSE